MKYVMFENQYGAKVPVIFCESLTHSEVAQVLPHAGDAQMLHPVSAGFYSTTTGATEGRSESMDLGSDPDDALYIWGGQAVAMLPVEMLRGLKAQWDKENSK